VSLTPAGDALLHHARHALNAVTAAAQAARRVDILFGGASDRADYLRDGRADVALLYAPFDDLTGLAHEELLVEGRAAWSPLAAADTSAGAVLASMTFALRLLLGTRWRRGMGTGRYRAWWCGGTGTRCW
jgi:DNA-binding transcriptional LysR family regulator